MGFRRYAIYHAPAPGMFAQAAARWLGWDAQTGRPVEQPDLPDMPLALHDLTHNPRRYGFHATLKPPFRLADGLDEGALVAAVKDLARQLAPVVMPGLRPIRHCGFVALVPDVAGGTTAPQAGPEQLNQLAARVVIDLDGLRAPLTQAEIARRNPHLLSPRQRALLDLYGYPHVLEAFRFHMTLSDGLDDATAAAVLPHAQAHFADVLPRPFIVDALSVFGEDDEGRFHLVHRVALAG